MQLKEKEFGIWLQKKTLSKSGKASRNISMKVIIRFELFRQNVARSNAMDIELDWIFLKNVHDKLCSRNKLFR